MKILRKIITVLIVLATLAIGMLFALQNTAMVPLDLLVYSLEPRSIALWVLSAFAIGGLMGMLACSTVLLRQRASIGTANRRLEKSRAEVGRLRETPADVSAQ